MTVRCSHLLVTGYCKLSAHKTCVASGFVGTKCLFEKYCMGCLQTVRAGKWSQSLCNECNLYMCNQCAGTPARQCALCVKRSEAVKQRL